MVAHQHQESGRIKLRCLSTGDKNILPHPIIPFEHLVWRFSWGSFFPCSPKYPWNQVPKALGLISALSQSVIHEWLVLLEMILVVELFFNCSGFIFIVMSIRKKYAVTLTCTFIYISAQDEANICI